MTEADLMRRIQIACCRDPMVRLWRNNVGEGWVGKLVSRTIDEGGLRIVLAHARHIDFGLGVGTGDLVGGHSRLITPEMVGARVFVFANLEIKTARGYGTDQQRTFIHVVKSLGGLAGIARNEDDARKVLTLDSP